MGINSVRTYKVLKFGISLVAFSTHISATAHSAEQLAQQTPQIEEIVVTGSQIRGARTTGAVPVSVISTQDIQALGGVSGEDLYRSLPQAGVVAFNTQTLRGGNQGSARGDVSSINLRGIGSGYTLVLINGRRTVPYGSSQGSQEFSYNANAIPTFGLERLEILRDGAAALYGADAVAGVVNNVLQSDYEGVKVEVQYGGAEGTNLRQLQANALWGTPIAEGRGNITTFIGYGNDSKLYARDQEYTATTDIRPLLAGTGFDNHPLFDARATGSPWGGFQVLGGPGTVRSNGVAVTNGTGQFHIQPSTNAGCLIQLGGGICMDDGTVTTEADRNLRYDQAAATEDLTITPSVDRYNFFSFVNYDISDDIAFFGEVGYYWSKTQSVSLPVGPLGNTPVTVPASNFYNPFGPITSPNRLPGLNIPDSGLPIRIQSYLTVDAGARIVDVQSDQARLLAGLRGEKFGWDWESAALYSSATTDDESDNIQTSLWQQAMNRATPDAYNPFNGGNIANPNLGDTTPSQDLTSYLIRAVRHGRKSLTMWDFKLSRPDLFELPAGGLGIATGVEVRRETTKDDRDRTGDFTAPFRDLVSGVSFPSDTLGSSAAYDVTGKRTVYSAYAELAVPVVSPEMAIPLMRAVDVQVAGRWEDYSDIGDVAKPKVAGSWDLVEGVRLRSSWQQGFKAPTLEQLPPITRPTEGVQLDDVRCEADLRAGRISNWGACTQRPNVQRLNSGNLALKPEKSESFSYGAVLQATFLPPEYGDLTVTADRWKIKQTDIVNIASSGNAITLDYLMRVQGSSNPNVVRATPTPDDIALVAGTGLAPFGAITAVLTSYENLDTRTIEGYDIGFSYNLSDTPYGDFGANVNVSRTLKYFQDPSPVQQQLLDAQAAGTINAATVIGGAANLLEDAGDITFLLPGGGPKWKWNAMSTWNTDNWGAGLTFNYTGRVFQFNIRNAANEPWEVKSQLTASLYGQYKFTDGALTDTVVTLGVRNITDEDPPLANLGYLGALYQPYARYWYGRIQKTF